MDSGAGGSVFGELRLPAVRDGATIPSIGEAPGLESDEDAGTRPLFLRFALPCARGLGVVVGSGKAPGLESDDGGSFPLFLRFVLRFARGLGVVVGSGKAPGLESNDGGSFPFSRRLLMRNDRCCIIIKCQAIEYLLSVVCFMSFSTENKTVILTTVRVL